MGETYGKELKDQEILGEETKAFLEGIKNPFKLKSNNWILNEQISPNTNKNS